VSIIRGGAAFVGPFTADEEWSARAFSHRRSLTSAAQRLVSARG